MKNRRILFPVLTLLVVVLLRQSVMSISTTDTRMMHQPAIGVNQIAFIYANDLWVAGLDGSGVRMLTSDAGVVSWEPSDFLNLWMVAV